MNKILGVVILSWAAGTMITTAQNIQNGASAITIGHQPASTNSSSSTLEQSAKPNQPDAGAKTGPKLNKPYVQKNGNFADGYLKQVTSVDVSYSGEVNGVSAVIVYSINCIGKTAMEQSEDGSSLLWKRAKVVVHGAIMFRDKDGKQTVTKLSGILFSNQQDVIGSWLMATDCPLPATDFSRLKDKLEKPLATGNPDSKDEPSPPVWLFQIQKDYSLVFQP
jgi:hypothetical protein